MNVLNVFIASLIFGLGACSTVHPTPNPASAGDTGRTFEEVFDLRAGGFRRTALLHVPRAVEARGPMALVVALHGAFGGAEQMESESGLSRLADREGFIAVYPNGYGFFGIARHWNSGNCCGPARAFGVDDVAFIDRVIDRVEARFPVDARRIYVVGFSNGGMMAHRYAAERADRVAGAAVVGGTIGGRPDTGEPVWHIPAASRPVPILLVHGTGDEKIPYAGTPAEHTRGRSWLSVDDAVSAWRASNRALGAPRAYRDGAVLRLAWGGDAPVVLLRIEGLGHVWPGPSEAGDPAGFDAAESIWSFFSRTSARGSAVAGRLLRDEIPGQGTHRRPPGAVAASPRSIGPRGALSSPSSG